MNQLCLIIPLARRSDPQTSHNAAAKAAPIAPTHRNIIAACIRDHGQLTVKEIADRTDLSQYAVSKRMVELERLAIIAPTGDERDGCRVWAVI